VYGLLTGVGIAAYTVWDAHAVTELGIAPVAFMVGCSLAEIPFFTALLLLEGRRGALARLRAELRRNRMRLLAFGLLSPLAYVLVLTAVTLAPVSLVAPVREVSVVLVGLYGAFRHRESRPALRLVAATVVVAGVVLVAL
jgi:drug/metabolite transporter (DMT)-like permease